MTITLNLADLAPLTDAHFQALCKRHHDYRLERTARGELQIMPPAGGGTGHRNSLLNHRLMLWAERAGGMVFDSSTGFKLPNGAIRSPDASWIEDSQWAALTDEEREGFLPLSPTLAIELSSPSDSVQELRAKMEEYLANGTRVGWLLLPRQGLVEVYRPGREVEVLEQPGGLSGDPELPGLILDLSSIL